MNDEMTSKQHYLVALLLGIVGLLVILIFVSLRSQADVSTTSATIENAAPTVDSITVSTASETGSPATFAPGEATTETLYVYGTYTDNNGCDTVSGQANYMVLYHSGASGAEACSASDKDCYNSDSYGYSCDWSMASNACSGAEDETAAYECNVPVQYFADSGTWTGYVYVTDGALSATKTDTISMDATPALNLSGNIDFGSIAYGATSTQQTLTITNTGNDNDLDITINATDLTCTDGIIDASSVKFSTSSSGVVYDSKVAASSTTANDAGFNLIKATASSTASTQSTYWQVQATPQSGSVLSGTCSGNLTIGALSN